MTTTLTYDGLNRVKSKTYTDGTPPVTYQYYLSGDGDTTGTLRSVGNSASTTGYTHDKFGRATANTQTTPTNGGTAYSFSYLVSLSDQVTNVNYPSGRSVTYGFDNADRVWTVAGKLSGATTNYTASGQYIAYTAAGGFVTVPLGSGVTESYAWNDRLQQIGIGAKKVSPALTLLALNFYPCDTGLTACPNNNGNIWRETVQNTNLTTAVTQEYRYDALNRLTSAGEGSNWSRAFSYDPYGNMYLSTLPPSGPPVDPTTPVGSGWIDSTRNRLVNPGVGIGYDNAGNMTSINGSNWSYDAENRLKSSTLGGNTTTYA